MFADVVVGLGAGLPVGVLVFDVVGVVLFSGVVVAVPVVGDFCAAAVGVGVTAGAGAGAATTVTSGLGGGGRGGAGGPGGMGYLTTELGGSV